MKIQREKEDQDHKREDSTQDIRNSQGEAISFKQIKILKKNSVNKNEVKFTILWKSNKLWQNYSFLAPQLSKVEWMSQKQFCSEYIKHGKDKLLVKLRYYSEVKREYPKMAFFFSTLNVSKRSYWCIRLHLNAIWEMIKWTGSRSAQLPTTLKSFMFYFFKLCFDLIIVFYCTFKIYLRALMQVYIYVHVCKYVCLLAGWVMNQFLSLKLILLL